MNLFNIAAHSFLFGIAVVCALVLVAGFGLEILQIKDARIRSALLMLRYVLVLLFVLVANIVLPGCGTDVAEQIEDQFDPPYCYQVTARSCSLLGGEGRYEYCRSPTDCTATAHGIIVNYDCATSEVPIHVTECAVNNRECAVLAEEC